MCVFIHIHPFDAGIILYLFQSLSEKTYCCGYEKIDSDQFVIKIIIILKIMFEFFHCFRLTHTHTHTHTHSYLYISIRLMLVLLCIYLIIILKIMFEFSHCFRFESTGVQRTDERSTFTPGLYPGGFWTGTCGRIPTGLRRSCIIPGVYGWVWGPPPRRFPTRLGFGRRNAHPGSRYPGHAARCEYDHVKYVREG